MDGGASVWFSLASMAIAATSAGVSAYSQHQQGKDANKAAQAQAKQYEQQAQISEAQAAVAQLQGEKEARRRYALLSQDVGSLYASFAGNGIDIGSGSVGRALTTTVQEAQEDVNVINSNTQMNVWTAMQNATQFRNTANITRWQGKAAKRTGGTSALATGVGGVGSTVQAGAAGYELGEKWDQRSALKKTV